MSRFTAPLVVTPLNDGRTWQVLYSSSSGPKPGQPDTFQWHRHFGYDIGSEGSGLTVDVPDGFETDFASIPRPLWWLLPSWGRYGNAAVIHDYLYAGGKATTNQIKPGGLIMMKLSPGLVLPMTRKGADLVFLEAMTVLEVSAWQKWMIYYGVRLGGWLAWRKARQ